MDTNTVIQELLDKAHDSVLSYSDYAPIVIGFDLTTLREVEAGLIDRGIKFDIQDISEDTANEDTAYRYNDMYVVALQSTDESVRELAKKNLILNNKRLVYRLAKPYKSTLDQHMFEDLTGAGIIGLCRSVDKYDFDKKSVFNAHAETWIRKEITIWLKDNTYMFTIPAGQKDINPVLDRIIKDLRTKDPNVEITYDLVKKSFSEYTKTDKNPSGRTLSKESFELYNALQAAGRPVSLDQEIGGDRISGDDKSAKYEEIIPSGEDLEQIAADRDERARKFAKVYYVEQHIGGESNIDKPKDFRAIFAQYVKDGYLATDQAVMNNMELRTNDELAAALIAQLKANDPEYFRADKHYTDYKHVSLTPEELEAYHFKIVGRHGETRTRTAPDGSVIRKNTEAINVDPDAFRRELQAMSTDEKIRLIVELNRVYPGDIIEMSNTYFNIQARAFVASKKQLIATDDIARSLGESRAPTGARLKEIDKDIKRILADMPREL